jgi:ABC-2 type transport system permease protein
MNGLALYRRYLGISLRGQLQYRASFVMQTFGQLLITGFEFLGIAALFARFGALGGFSLPEVAFFYGLCDVSFALADAMGRGFESVGTLLKSGDFDRLLLRPRSTVLQVLGQELTLKRFGRFAQGVVVMAWAAGAAHVVWTVPKVLLLLAACAGGVCLFLGVFMLQAASCFWTIETLEIWNAFSYGGNFAAQYPLPIFRRWFRRFLMVVLPLACVNYWPAIAILDHPDPLGTPAFLPWVSPLAGGAFLALAWLAWRAGLRRYASTGS